MNVSVVRTQTTKYGVIICDKYLEATETDGTGKKVSDKEEHNFFFYPFCSFGCREKMYLFICVVKVK